MAPVEPSPSSVLNVEVAVGMAPRQVARRSLSVQSGCTVRQALDASGLLDQPGGPTWVSIASGEWFVGIWGRRTELDHVLRVRDRVEVYRGLKVDPKEARRVRYRTHGEKLPKGIHRPTKSKSADTK